MGEGPVSDWKPPQPQPHRVLVADIEQSLMQRDHESADIYAKRALAAAKEQALREAMAAAEGERLHEDTGTEPDKAYERAIDDVIAAIRALLPKQQNDG